jgi:predicted Zn-dependent peptidase
MSRLATAEIVSGEFMDLDESLSRFEQVTLSEVQDLAAELVSRPRSLVAVGDVDQAMFDQFVS